jgi:hypothetical protein
MALQQVKTASRLRTSVNFYAMPDPLAMANILNNLTGGSGVANAAILTGAALAGSKLNLQNGGFGTGILSSVTNFSRTQTRTVTKRYGLGTNSFEALQVVPGPIDTKLMMERVVLYKNDSLKQVFGFWGEHMASQQIPMMIIEYKDRQVEATNIANEERAAIMYTDCWMTTNPVEYDINAEDLLILQDREIEVGKVIVADTTLGGIASAANYALNIGKEIKII